MTVTVERYGYVALVEFDRPPFNHVSVESMSELADALEALDQETDVRAIVLATAGKVFCAGADLANDSKVVGGGGAKVNPLYVQAVRLFSTRTPIIAAVQGAAIGAGLGLALIADFRIASHEARFSANFTKLGFHPGFGITHTLPRVVGETNAALLMLTGRRIKPDEALRMGLVDEVAEDARVSALALAAEIAEAAPLAVQSTRATLRRGLAAAVKAQTDLEHIEQTWLRDTADFKEGIASVAERRVGNFTGS